MPDQLSQSRVWRFLRRLLPRRYRERYARELLQLHADRARKPGGVLFWIGVTGDALLTALQLRLDALRAPETTAAPRSGFFDTIRHSFMMARRSVLRAPGFTIAVVLTLALGIGANATMFAILDRLLFSPPPHIAQAQQVRRVLTYGKSVFRTEVGYN